MYSEMLLKVADEPFLSDSTYSGKHSAKSSNLFPSTRYIRYQEKRNPTLTSIYAQSVVWQVVKPNGNESTVYYRIDC